MCVDFSIKDWAELWKRIKKEKVVITESKHRKKGGEIFPVYIRSNFVEFEGKEYSVSIALDVTKRVEAEAQIRLQHQLLKNTINSLTHPFYVIDAESFEIILANDASGFNETKTKLTCHSVTHNSDKPCDGNNHVCPVAKIKKSKKARTVEHLHKDDKGNDKYVEIHAYPIFDDSGEVSNVIEYSIDITERKKADENLRFALDEVKRLKNQLEAENIYLQQEIKLEHNFEEIISKSKTFKNVLNKVEQVASTDATVLVLGETGTGKELLARAIHNISKRRNRPLVKVNCATLPANLIESELFGHEKGSFTGAHAQKTGRFELANGGTIFLDEIGDLPRELQTKLLRVLQEGEFERLGSSQTMKVDVRIIAATNVNLEEAIEEGKFRNDLYYRLNVFPIIIPPLRDRRDDIPLLVHHFVNKYSKKNSRNIESIPQNTMKALQNYPWPGNIRELENIIERGVIISTGNQLELGDWLPKGKKIRSTQQTSSLNDYEKEYILEVLEMTNWRVSGEKGAAKILDIKPTTLEARMKKLGISRKT
ncbi:MAG: sigma 54-interacting transcriptional regulator [Bacteroidales bacterium]|nr:sigma 54-interacting transcriptional regulator [Bacteroidales bacterium]